MIIELINMCLTVSAIVVQHLIMSIEINIILRGIIGTRFR